MRGKKVIKPISYNVDQNKDIDLTRTIYTHYNKNTDDDRTYFFNRGLTKGVIDRYKLCVASPKDLLKNDIGLLPNVKNPDVYEYILPVWENSKVVSFIARRNDKKSKDSSKTLNLKGVKARIFNLDLLRSDEKTIFVTEGVFDCLSIESSVPISLLL